MSPKVRRPKLHLVLLLSLAPPLPLLRLSATTTLVTQAAAAAGKSQFYPNQAAGQSHLDLGQPIKNLPFLDQAGKSPIDRLQVNKTRLFLGRSLLDLVQVIKNLDQANRFLFYPEQALENVAVQDLKTGENLHARIPPIILTPENGIGLGLGISNNQLILVQDRVSIIAEAADMTKKVW